MPRFMTGSCQAAVESLAAACDSAGVTMVEATYRWLMHHSALGEGDGLLLGASSLPQLQQNLDACCEDEPLPAEVVAAFNEAWALVQKGGDDEPFPYWRSYSADHPDRESLPPGAGYVAKGPK
mmetsp:Transcript_20204/g.46851  ORF Transcript_20204/g.46851 Transcript_20204/m.46851 type:complete len:123 (+) Transcript_20204:838-1206(+)